MKNSISPERYLEGRLRRRRGSRFFFFHARPFYFPDEGERADRFNLENKVLNLKRFKQD